ARLTTRLWAPRFSLRMLLAAFTAVAIGIPVWYRWPYEEEEDIPSRERIVNTWQRQWGGGRLLHGPRTWFRSDGSKQYVTHFVRGERHGRFEAWEPGRPETIGYFEHDQKSGTWTTDTDALRTIQTWKHNQLNGPCEFLWPDGRTERMTFTQGRLTEVNGRPWPSPLYDAHHRRETRDESRAIDDVLYSNLNSPLTINFQDVPLSSAVAHLAADSAGLIPAGGVGTPILLDPRLPDPHLPVTYQVDGLDVKTALVLLLARHELVADYHYGAVWVTTPELAGPWHDPTGIDKITPPEGSPLAGVWDEPVDVTTTWSTPIYPGQQPLAKVIAEAFGPLMIEIDTSRLAPTTDDPGRFPVVANLQKIPFRHALAYLLFQAKCRCELRGETLVILPPKNEP
ncbi:MAG TPA: hypothetical protein VFV87_04660, partial [Pirellulaceae bacterium]|nr:hypothetical protein [Pirellulaceae bacterium]